MPNLAFSRIIVSSYKYSRAHIKIHRKPCSYTCDECTQYARLYICFAVGLRQWEKGPQTQNITAIWIGMQLICYNHKQCCRYTYTLYAECYRNLEWSIIILYSFVGRLYVRPVWLTFSQFIRNVVFVPYRFYMHKYIPHFNTNRDVERTLRTWFGRPYKTPGITCNMYEWKCVQYVHSQLCDITAAFCSTKPT